jgi:hypothetical protein
VRTVRRTPFFEAGAARIQVYSRRFDEAIEAVEWSISENPLIWPEVVGTPFRVAITRPFRAIPALRIAFTIDDENTCTLHADSVRNVLD